VPLGAPLKTFDITAVLQFALPTIPGVTISPTGLALLQAGTPDLQRDALATVPSALANLHAGGRSILSAAPWCPPAQGDGPG